MAVIDICFQLRFLLHAKAGRMPLNGKECYFFNKKVVRFPRNILFSHPYLTPGSTARVVPRPRTQHTCNEWPGLGWNLDFPIGNTPARQLLDHVSQRKMGATFKQTEQL